MQVSSSFLVWIPISQRRSCCQNRKVSGGWKTIFFRGVWFFMIWSIWLKHNSKLICLSATLRWNYFLGFSFLSLNLVSSNWPRAENDSYLIVEPAKFSLKKNRVWNPQEIFSFFFKTQNPKHTLMVFHHVFFWRNILSGHAKRLENSLILV